LYATNAALKANGAAPGTQRVHLASGRRPQFLGGGLDRPAPPVPIGDDLGAGALGRHVRQQVEFGLPVARRSVREHRHPPQDQDLARAVGGPDRLLEDLAGVDPAAGPPLPDEPPAGRRGAWSDHGGSAPLNDPEEEVRRAEVAVGDPEVLRRDQLQDPAQRRALLRMAVFAQDHVGGQHQPGVEHDRRMTGPGRGADRPQLLEPVPGAGEVVPVEAAAEWTRAADTAVSVPSSLSYTAPMVAPTVSARA
jgi:hypothetical protein